jgi:chaperonin GroES
MLLLLGCGDFSPSALDSALVIAVGPGGRDENGKLIPIDIQVGDRVLFGKWSGTEVKIDGEELLIMKQSDVMGVITDTHTKKKAA